MRIKKNQSEHHNDQKKWARDENRENRLLSYVKILIEYARWKMALALGLLILVGLMEGIGLLMLVPFLHLVGFAAEGSTGMIEIVKQVFEFLHLSLTLQTVLCLYIGLIAFQAFLVRWRELLLTEIQLGFVDHLRLQLYQAIGRANWLFLLRKRSSDLSHVLTSDINRVGEGTYLFLTIIVSGFLALIHIIVAFQLSALMTLIALLTGGLLLLILWPQVHRAKILGEQLTNRNREVFGTVSEFLDGIKLAKSYGTEERYHQTFTETIFNLRQQLLDFTRSNSWTRMIFQIGAAIALSALLYIAAVILVLPVAELLVLILVFARLLPILSNLQRHYQHFVHVLPAFASARGMQARCEAEAEPRLIDNHWKPTLREDIRLQQVYFRYDQQNTQNVLSDINLVISAQQTTAIVGASGAGKSTLADLLMGLLMPDRGEILVDGQPLHAKRTRLWRQIVAYVPQETFLFHDTVRANLLWAQPEASEETLWQTLQLAAADQFVAGLADGLDTVVGDRGVRLSGGERQRIALARALLYQPSLLILDEATSALDTEHERRIQQAIEALHGEMTIVVIAHRLSTVRHADQIAVMEKGKIVEMDTWNALEAREGGRLKALLQGATIQ
jgi:ATP-binding cassette, subfamily C, bacterial